MWCVDDPLTESQPSKSLNSSSRAVPLFLPERTSASMVAEQRRYDVVRSQISYIRQHQQHRQCRQISDHFSPQILLEDELGKSRSDSRGWAAVSSACCSASRNWRSSAGSASLTTVVAILQELVGFG
ncbi:hypothetical protein Q3G72_031251 [Acer saccharum]|nr:hypothetical protein Q3G72_031251 [Acer saccharum]